MINSSLATYFPLKNCAFEAPSPSEFSLTFFGVGKVIFWNCTIEVLCEKSIMGVKLIIYGN